MSNFDATGLSILLILVLGAWFVADRLGLTFRLPKIEKLEYKEPEVKTEKPKNMDSLFLEEFEIQQELAEWWKIKEEGGKYRPPAHLWLPVLAQDFCHLMVITETGGGKTTFMRALRNFVSYQGEILWISPKAQYNNDPYAVGYGLDYESIGHAFKRLMILKKERYNEFKYGKEDFMHLYVFIDEWSAIKMEMEEEAVIFMKSMSNEARQAHIHLIIANQSELVEDLGIKGSSATRENFTQIYLAKKAREFLPKEFEYTEKHCMALKSSKSVTPLGSDEIPTYAGLGYRLNSGWSLYHTLKGTDKTTPKPKPTNKVDSVAIEHPSNPEVDLIDLGVMGFSEHHVKVSHWLSKNPELSSREVARRLWGGNGGGKRNTQATKLIEEVKAVLSGVHIIPCSLEDDNLLEFKISK